MRLRIHLAKDRDEAMNKQTHINNIRNAEAMSRVDFMVNSAINLN